MIKFYQKKMSQSFPNVFRTKSYKNLINKIYNFSGFQFFEGIAYVFQDIMYDLCMTTKK